MAIYVRGEDGEYRLRYGEDEDQSSVDAILQSALQDPTVLQALAGGAGRYRIQGANGGNQALIRSGEDGEAAWRAGNWGTRGYGAGDTVTKDGLQYNRIGSASLSDRLTGKLFQGRPFSDYVAEDPEWGTLMRSDALAGAGAYNKKDIGTYLPLALMALATAGIGAAAGAGIGAVEAGAAGAAGAGAGGVAAGGLGAELALGGAAPWASSIPGFGTAGAMAGAGAAGLDALIEAAGALPGASMTTTLPSAALETAGGSLVNAGSSTISEMINAIAQGGGIEAGAMGTGAQAAELASALGTGGMAAGGVSGVGTLADILQTTTSGAGGLPYTPSSTPSFPSGEQAPAPVENRTIPGQTPGTTVIPPGSSTSIVGPATGSAATGAATQLLNKAFGTQLTDTDTELIGNLIRGGIGYAGATSQADALREIAGKTDAMQEPWRKRLSDMYADPTSFMTSAPVTATLDQGTQAAARALSTRYGNPAMSPNALGEINKYTANTLYGKFGEEANRLAAFGGLNFPATASQGVQVGAANADSGVYDVLGSTIGNMFAPKRQQTSIADVLRAIQSGNLYGTTIGP